MKVQKTNGIILGFDSLSIVVIRKFPHESGSNVMDDAFPTKCSSHVPQLEFITFFHLHVFLGQNVLKTKSSGCVSNSFFFVVIYPMHRYEIWRL